MTLIGIVVVAIVDTHRSWLQQQTSMQVKTAIVQSSCYSFKWLLNLVGFITPD
jgi:hypothetical protein